MLSSYFNFLRFYQFWIQILVLFITSELLAVKYSAPWYLSLGKKIDKSIENSFKYRQLCTGLHGIKNQTIFLLSLKNNNSKNIIYVYYVPCWHPVHTSDHHEHTSDKESLVVWIKKWVIPFKCPAMGIPMNDPHEHHSIGLWIELYFVTRNISQNKLSMCPTWGRIWPLIPGPHITVFSRVGGGILRYI